jgi:chaperonin cofactor prefoldin
MIRINGHRAASLLQRQQEQLRERSQLLEQQQNRLQERLGALEASAPQS